MCVDLYKTIYLNDQSTKSIFSVFNQILNLFCAIFVCKPLKASMVEDSYFLYRQIEDRLDQLEAKQRIELMIKLMPYVFPKLHSSSHTINEPMDTDWVL